MKGLSAPAVCVDQDLYITGIMSVLLKLYLSIKVWMSFVRNYLFFGLFFQLAGSYLRIGIFERVGLFAMVPEMITFGLFLSS